VAQINRVSAFVSAVMAADFQLFRFLLEPLKLSGDLPAAFAALRGIEAPASFQAQFVELWIREGDALSSDFRFDEAAFLIGLRCLFPAYGGPDKIVSSTRSLSASQRRHCPSTDRLSNHGRLSCRSSRNGAFPRRFMSPPLARWRRLAAATMFSGIYFMGRARSEHRPRCPS
jgi:hypothetical protein